MIKLIKWDDKDSHKLAGTIITFVTSFTLYKATEINFWLCLLFGLLSGVLAGLAKEYVWDKHLKKGTFSKDDIYATSWGALIGAVVFGIYVAASLGLGV